MKTLLLFYEDVTTWDSCVDINSGLYQFYTLMFDHCEKFYVSDNDDTGLKLLELVRKENIQRIISIDHRVRAPKEFFYFKEPENRYLLESIEIIYHIYGCFVDRMWEWSFFNKYFKSVNIKFVASSDTFKEMVEDFFEVGRCILLPFPVDEHKFKNLKQFSKEDLNLSEDDKVLLYVGRVSFGKNVLGLCKFIEQYNKNNKDDLKLIIVGAIDDMSWPFGNELVQNGAMSFTFANLLEDINKTEQIVHYIPHTNDKNYIFGLYELADAIISLSTMKNEDYGITITDAIVMGKKTICTKWGGYKSFLKYSSHIYSVPIQVNESVSFEEEDLFKSISQALNNKSVLGESIQVDLSVSTLLEKYSYQFEEENYFRGMRKLGQFLANSRRNLDYNSKLALKLFKDFYV